jgi:integrase
MAIRKMHLAKAAINALPPPAQITTIWDDELSGFGLLVLPSGTKTFIIHRRTRTGRQIRIKIGRVGELSAEQARTEAKRLCAQISLGHDPAAERRAARQQQQEHSATPTVARLAELWQQANADRWAPKTAKAYGSWLATHVLPALGRSKANEVQPADIRRMYKAIVARTPATADQVLRTASALYAWAVANDDLPMITSNPCVRVLTPDLRGPGAAKREREPEGDELERLVRALEDRADLIGVFFLVLLLTGAREGELLGAMWRDFDLDGERPTWRKRRTKTGKPHRVTLNSEAVELLRAVKAEQPFSPFGWLKIHRMRDAWAEVCTAAGVTDLRIHDWARHFHACILASQGFNLLDVGKALGHRSQQTSARYTHVVERRQREAATKLGEVVRLAGRRKNTA